MSLLGAISLYRSAEQRWERVSASDPKKQFAREVFDGVNSLMPWAPPNGSAGMRRATVCGSGWQRAPTIRRVMTIDERRSVSRKWSRHSEAAAAVRPATLVPAWHVVLSASRLANLGYSLADQILAVGGMFAVNIALARVRSKEEYGIFTLSYSVFTFLTGLHNAAILEAYTIYGSGRYHGRFSSYGRFVAEQCRANGRPECGFAGSWQILRWLHPAFASPALLGMALTCGVLLTAAFWRRTFYIRRRPDLAVRFSAAFFVSCMNLLGLAIWAGLLNGLSAFLIQLRLGRWPFRLRRNPTHANDDKKDDAREKTAGLAEAGTRFSARRAWLLGRALEVFPLGVCDRAGFPIHRRRPTSGWWRRFFPYAMSPNYAPCTTWPYRSIRSSRPTYAAGAAADGLAFRLRRTGKLRRCGGAARCCFWHRFGVCLGRWVGKYLDCFTSSMAASSTDVAPLLRWYVLVPVVMGVGNAANAALKAAEKPQAVFAAYLASGIATFVRGHPFGRPFRTARRRLWNAGVGGQLCGNPDPVFPPVHRAARLLRTGQLKRLDSKTQHQEQLCGKTTKRPIARPCRTRSF